jgi:CheY-like chemotaxis protein
LRELEVQLRAALEAAAAARRCLDEGKTTAAAVELDDLDARLESGREAIHDLLEGAGQTVERVPSRRRVRLGPLLGAWAEDADRACAASGIVLAGTPAQDGDFELDRAKVGRLLEHVLSSALVRGTGELELRCRVEADGPSRAVLVFEAMRRPVPRTLEATATELRARRLAQVLGGSFERCCALHETVFRASVPARVLSDREEGAPIRLSGARVLVVEDDDDARAALALLLEDMELEVVAAASYEEALSAFAPGVFRLALLDVDLNGRSGVELHEKLRARDSGVGVIFLSGSESSRGLASLAPARYLMKPVDVAALERTIKELLEPARLPAGA